MYGSSNVSTFIQLKKIYFNFMRIYWNFAEIDSNIFIFITKRNIFSKKKKKPCEAPHSRPDVVVKAVEIAIGIAPYGYELVVLARDGKSRSCETGFVTFRVYSTKRFDFANFRDEGKHDHFTVEGYVQNLDVTVSEI